MDALFQLCDLIAQNPAQFGEKLTWICSRCPTFDSLSSGSPKVTRSQLNALIAVARFLSKCPNSSDNRPKVVIIEFLKSLPASFTHRFWPLSFGTDSISSFFVDFLGYVAKATELSQEFAAEVAGFMGEVLMNAVVNGGEDLDISRAFLTALSGSFLPVLPTDGDKLVNCLLDHYVVPNVPMSATDLVMASEISSAQSSPANNYPQINEASSPVNQVSHASASFSSGIVINAGVSGSAGVKPHVGLFEEESVESLEKLEIGFKFIGHILALVGVDPRLLDQVRLIAKRQLQLMSAFLKIRKRDWSDQGPHLKARFNTKLNVYLAAAWMQVRSLTSLDSDAKSSKRLLLETLALLIDAAETCLYSVWRKLKACEELFASLLNGIALIAVSRGGQLLRILLIRLKPLVLITCTQAGTRGSSQGTTFESIIKTSCEMIEFGWSKDRAAVDTFIMGLTTSLRDRNDFEEKDEKAKLPVSNVQLNVIRLLTDLAVRINKTEVVDMILPLFIECLEEGEASSPDILRLQLLYSVSRLASLGFEKSYRETVVLMTRSYLNKLNSIEFTESKTEPLEADSERIETLPAGFLRIASGLSNNKLRADYRHRLLSLCSDVGLVAESKNGSCGAEFLGPLLPAVADICSDFDPTGDVELSLLKLFRNLWFYIALYGLAPPIQKNQISTKLSTNNPNNVGITSTVAFQAVGGPYMSETEWSSAVQRIAQGTPALVVSSVKWLEDEMELNALHNPGCHKGNVNEKGAVNQRSALSAALGGRIEVSAMSTIAGVKATYLLAVTFLEIIRFSSNGGILNGGSSVDAGRSAFSCVFEYLKTPNLASAVSQCLTAMVHQAFGTAVSWLEYRITETGDGAEAREDVLSAHACFLIKNLSQKDEHIRDISVKLLIQLRDRFQQLLWNSSCLDSLIFSVHSESSYTLAMDPGVVAAIRSLYQKIVREWIVCALSYAPCTSQGLLQEKLCKLNTYQRTQHTPDVVSLLSEIQLGTGKNDYWTGIRTTNIPAVMAAAAAASGANFKLNEAFNLEVLSTGIVSATVKSNHAGEIAGMTKLYDKIGGLQPTTLTGSGLGLQRFRSGVSNQLAEPKHTTIGGILICKYVSLLQQFVHASERGGEIDKSIFRETCSQATALLLSNLDADAKSNVEGFSQLLRLLCWCPAYITTPDAMETGVFVWTWLVSAAPQLGSLVLAELVDAWLWTIDTKRGLFASEARFSGPVARLRPHLAPGEREAVPERDPIEQIIAHRSWVGFLIDRFEVVRHNSVEQLLLLGRMLQGTTRLPLKFSHHPAATGTFFTVMLLGLKFCSCRFQGNLQSFKTGLQLLEDRIYRASLGWFAHKSEMFDLNHSFAESEAQSVLVFVHHLLHEGQDASLSNLEGRGQEKGTSAGDMLEHHHPVWGHIENYASGREKWKQLLLMLSQLEANRLEVLAHPNNSKDNLSSRLKISSDKWIEYARTAFSVDPRIALSLPYRFLTIPSVKGELTQLVQAHLFEIRAIPEALPYFVTPKAVDENSPLLQQLPHWAACSITQALEFLSPAYKGHSRVMAYVLRVLESYPPECVTFFMAQLVQALRYDAEKLVEGYLLRATQRSDLFAHLLIWRIQGEAPEETSKDGLSVKSTAFEELLPALRQKIIDGFTTKALELFKSEFDFFDKVTSISGVLLPLPKDERRAGIRRELEKIQVEGEDLYLPTAPSKLVRRIRVDSGIPLQSAAKVPIMVTFDVIDRLGDRNKIMPQACIFKVGDDCRQDVLALQVIALLRDIFDAAGLNLYLYPYGVLPTGPGRGIVEVVPNDSRSRSQMGETTDGGLYEIFQQEFGAVGSSTFESARENFIRSCAGYAVASLLLQPKDRHNGNILFDNAGRLVHIDFGFILETSPGGNMRFESAHFKLSHEMTQLLDPSGVMKSDTWYHFVGLCVKGYLAARQYMDGIITTVKLMIDSGLPCFSRGDPIGNLRKRFHPEMSEREAANFMIKVCEDAYNKWTTSGYDLIQYLQQGIEK